MKTETPKFATDRLRAKWFGNIADFFERRRQLHAKRATARNLATINRKKKLCIEELYTD